MVGEHVGVEGERKEVDVKDYPKAAAIAQILKERCRVSCRQEKDSTIRSEVKASRRRDTTFIHTKD